MRLEPILLGVLLQRPQTGYELAGFMDQVGRYLRDNTSMTQLYRSLRQMEQHGWLTHSVEPRPGAKDAKRYTVTDEGRATFMRWLHEPYDPSEQPGGGEFHTRLRFYAAFAGIDSVLELLDTEIAYRRMQIARNRHRNRSEWVDPAMPFDHVLTGTIVDWMHHRGIDHMDRHVDACTGLRNALADGKVPLDDCPNSLLRISEFGNPDGVPTRSGRTR